MINIRLFSRKVKFIKPVFAKLTTLKYTFNERLVMHIIDIDALISKIVKGWQKIG